MLQAPKLAGWLIMSNFLSIAFQIACFCQDLATPFSTECGEKKTLFLSKWTNTPWGSIWAEDNHLSVAGTKRRWTGNLSRVRPASRPMAAGIGSRPRPQIWRLQIPFRGLSVTEEWTRVLLWIIVMLHSWNPTEAQKTDTRFVQLFVWKLLCWVAKIFLFYKSYRAVNQHFRSLSSQIEVLISLSSNTISSFLFSKLDLQWSRSLIFYNYITNWGNYDPNKGFAYGRLYLLFQLFSL